MPSFRIVRLDFVTRSILRASQDLEDFGQRLPRDLASLPILIVRQQRQDDCDHNDFRVRTWLVLRLLEVLPRIHPEVYGPRELDGKTIPAVAPNPEMISRLEALGCGERCDTTSNGISVYRELPTVDADGTTESANGPAGDTIITAAATNTSHHQPQRCHSLSRTPLSLTHRPLATS